MHVGVVLLLLVQDSGDLSAMTRKDSELGAALGRFSLALRDLCRPSEGEILPECFGTLLELPSAQSSVEIHVLRFCSWLEFAGECYFPPKEPCLRNSEYL